MDRRFFAFRFLPLLALAGCRELVAPQMERSTSTLKSNPQDYVASGSVADFLQKQGMNPVFTENTEWGFPGGHGCLLMVDFATFGQGDYEYYIDDTKVQVPINLMEFHSNRQKITIYKNSQRVWGRRPPQPIDVVPRREIAIEYR